MWRCVGLAAQAPLCCTAARRAGGQPRRALPRWRCRAGCRAIVWSGPAIEPQLRHGVPGARWRASDAKGDQPAESPLAHARRGGTRARPAGVPAVCGAGSKGPARRVEVAAGRARTTCMAGLARHSRRRRSPLIVRRSEGSRRAARDPRAKEHADTSLAPHRPKRPPSERGAGAPARPALLPHRPAQQQHVEHTRCITAGGALRHLAASALSPTPSRPAAAGDATPPSEDVPASHRSSNPPFRTLLPSQGRGEGGAEGSPCNPSCRDGGTRRGR